MDNYLNMSSGIFPRGRWPGRAGGGSGNLGVRARLRAVDFRRRVAVFTHVIMLVRRPIFLAPMHGLKASIICPDFSGAAP